MAKKKKIVEEVWQSEENPKEQGSGKTVSGSVEPVKVEPLELNVAGKLTIDNNDLQLVVDKLNELIKKVN